MEKPKIFLDALNFEVRYSHGQLFWDRCGQTLLDIENECTGWFAIPSQAEGSGILENIEKDMIVKYSYRSFLVQAKKPGRIGLDPVLQDIKKCWKIVKANFGLDIFERVGCRLNYLIPEKSLDECEKILKKSKFNIVEPETLKDKDYKLKVRHVIGIFERDDIEHRVELHSVVRSEGINPTELFKGDPRGMSKNQRRYRTLKLKQMSRYEANPMFAVMLDVDNVQYDPENINVAEYIEEQIDIVKKDFLPIVE